MMMANVGEFQVNDPDAAVWGRSLAGVLHGIDQEAAISILHKYHLTSIDPDSWYPLQLWCRVLSDFTTYKVDLVGLGIRMMAALVPPCSTTCTLLDRLQQLDSIYTSAHLGEVGHLATRALHPAHVVIDVNVPYPDDVVYGAVWYLCQDHLPIETSFAITYDASTPPRKEGGTHTRLHVRWS